MPILLIRNIQKHGDIIAESNIPLSLIVSGYASAGSVGMPKNKHPEACQALVTVNISKPPFWGLYPPNFAHNYLAKRIR